MQRQKEETTKIDTLGHKRFRNPVLFFILSLPFFLSTFILPSSIPLSLPLILQSHFHSFISLQRIREMESGIKSHASFKILWRKNNYFFIFRDREKGERRICSKIRKGHLSLTEAGGTNLEICSLYTHLFLPVFLIYLRL